MPTRLTTSTRPSPSERRSWSDRGADELRNGLARGYYVRARCLQRLNELVLAIDNAKTALGLALDEQLRQAIRTLLRELMAN